MTEDVWLGSERVEYLVRSLQPPHQVSGRKLRLFAVACCHRIPKHNMSQDALRIVEVAEQYAEGKTSRSRLKRAHGWAFADGRSSSDIAARWTASSDVQSAAANASGFARESITQITELQYQLAALRCVVGDPFRPVAFAPAWRTSTALALAQAMYTARDFGNMPILADALEEAGCDNTDILDHCRGPEPHVRGCWVVDLVLGKA